VKGVTIHIRFTYSNTSSNPTLNVNSTGAKPLYLYGTSTSDRTAVGTTVSESWKDGAVVALTYDTTINTSGCWIVNDYRAWYAQNVGYTPDDSSWNVTDVAGALDDLKANASSAAAPVYIEYGDEDAYSKISAALTAGKRVYCIYTEEDSAYGSTDTAYIPLTYWYHEPGEADYYYFQVVRAESLAGGVYQSTNELWTVEVSDSDSWSELEKLPWGGTYTGVSPISVSGSTISHVNSGVSASTYTAAYNDKTSSWYIPTITVNATGHITSAVTYGTALSFSTLDSRFTNRGYYKPGNGPWVLQSTSTSSTITFSNPLSTGFYVTDIKAWDADGVPVIIDWSMTSGGYIPSTSSATVTVSVSEAYGKAINYIPVITTMNK